MTAVRDKVRTAIHNYLKAEAEMDEANKNLLACEKRKVAAVQEVIRQKQNHYPDRAVTYCGRRYNLAPGGKALEILPSDEVSLD